MFELPLAPASTCHIPEVAAYCCTLLCDSAHSETCDMITGVTFACSRCRWSGLQGVIGTRAGVTDVLTCAGSFISSMAQLAPEMLNRQPGRLGTSADTWAAGMLAVRLLTNYFPFDDIVGVSASPFLPSQPMHSLCSGVMVEMTFVNNEAVSAFQR
jgi:serine/threonine protein kinase